MSILEMVISSVVVVAIIEYIAKQKSNRLEFITRSREKWRDEIRRIVSELSECYRYDKTCKRLVADLKVNINGYGVKNYYDKDIKLNIMKDEHIWKALENLKNDSEFREARDKLISYLSLLLKFDWERSKEEVVSNKMLLMGNVIYILASIWLISPKVIINHSDLSKLVKEISPCLFMLILIYIVQLLPLFLEYSKIFHYDYLHRRIYIPILCLFVAAVFLCMLLFGISNTDENSSEILFMLSYALFNFAVLKNSIRYAEYDRAVKNIMNSPTIYVYWHLSAIGELKYSEKMANYNLYSSKQSKANLNLEEYKKTMTDDAWKLVMRKRWYNKYKKVKKKVSIYDYINRNRKCLKKVIGYNGILYPKEDGLDKIINIIEDEENIRKINESSSK